MSGHLRRAQDELAGLEHPPSFAEIEPDPEPQETDVFWPDGMRKVRHGGFLMNREWTARYWARRGGS